jgi:hypothetical protein
MANLPIDIESYALFLFSPSYILLFENEFSNIPSGDGVDKSANYRYTEGVR